MNLSALKWIIALMGFALIGLIAFQLYWIDSVLTASQERFRKDVLEAMNHVAVKLEKQETVATFQKIRNLNQEVQKESRRPRPSERSDARTKQDSALNGQTLDEIQMHAQLDEQTKAAVSRARNIERRLRPLQENIKQQVWFDTVRVGNNMQIVLNYQFENFQIPTFDESLFEEQISVDQERVELESQLQQKETLIADLEERLDRVSSKYEQTTNVLEELLLPRRSLSSRLDPLALDSLLREELDNKGIPLAFHYGIYSNRLKNFLLLSEPREKTSLVKSDMRASLFPNDIRGPHSQLVLEFPNRSKYLLEKIWLTLVSSGVLVLVIVFCFGYSIRTILRQKKLSIIKNDFINNMTHEFKTPIATISLASEALQDDDVNRSEDFRNRYVKIIEDENRRLGSQVERVLQIAALDKKDFNLKKEWVDLHLLIEELVDNTKIQAEKKGGRLIQSLQAKSTQLFVDATHITNSILNLLDNAIKYSPEEPNISVETSNQNGHVLVSVQDHGMGMSKETQKHIFEKFYRVPTGNRHDIKGFGLGLSYVKTMIEAHEGHIDVESSPGKGSRFTIALPVHGKS